MTMSIFLVEDIANSPGKIYFITKDQSSAWSVSNVISDMEGTECTVTERTLFDNEPPILGYNE